MRRALILLLLIVAASCSSGGGTPKVTLDDFSIELDADSLDAGQTSLEVRNVGAQAHELQFIRTRLRDDKLPVKDGLVDTDARGLRVVDKTELVAAGEQETFATRLEPGSYVLICNVAGHYTSGMRSTVRVARPAPSS